MLKLENGYNIGLNKKEILEIKLLRKLDKEKDNFELKNDSKKPNIALIITGGTIASRLDSKKGGVTPLDSPESFFSFYPEIFEKANILKFEVPFMKDSSEMDFKDWKKLAKICEKYLKNPDIKGIIITQGTDTLHYTSSALSFFIQNPNKPIVLTYSQRSIDRASSDASLNLECSTLVAISNIEEVVVVGHGSENDDFCYAIAGAKVRKMHSSKRDAFKSINRKPFAKIYRDKIEILSEFSQNRKEKFKLDLKFEDKIALLKYYPGQNPDILDYYLKNKYKGIILEMFGLGQISRKWIKKIKELSNKGIFICATSQTINGRINSRVYSIARELESSGVVYLEDMLSETAFVKLGWVLGHKEWIFSKEKFKEKMLHNFSHELNERLIG